jgi:hypothetical protein
MEEYRMARMLMELTDKILQDTNGLAIFAWLVAVYIHRRFPIYSVRHAHVMNVIVITDMHINYKFTYEEKRC